jgi:hypothetical protein
VQARVDLQLAVPGEDQPLGLAEQEVPLLLVASGPPSKLEGRPE